MPERSADGSSEEDAGLLETESGVITLTIVLVTVMMILMVWVVGRHIRNQSRDGVDASKSQKKTIMTDLQVPSRFENWLTSPIANSTDRHADSSPHHRSCVWYVFIATAASLRTATIYGTTRTFRCPRTLSGTLMPTST